MDIVTIIRLATIVLGGLAFGAAAGLAIRARRYRIDLPTQGTFIGALGSLFGIIALEVVLVAQFNDGFSAIVPLSFICFGLVLCGRWLTAEGK